MFVAKSVNNMLSSIHAGWLIFVLVACIASSVAVTAPNGDISHWRTCRVKVGHNAVIFKIPPGESSDFINPEIPKQIDISRSDIFDEAGAGPRLLARYWDYRKSHFVQTVGTLHAFIALYRSENTLDTVDSLKEAELENASLVRMYQAMDPGSGRLRDSLRFEPAVVAGKAGLRVRHKFSPPTYAVVLDEHHYLTIYTEGSVSQPGWREDIQAAKAAIFDSIIIEPLP